jgi:hypothetical protein
MRLWLPLLFLLPLTVAAREPARGTMNRATAAINVDGVLDEADWAQAPLLGDIIQREPRQGVAATEKTDVKLLFDKDHFYVGVTCYDSEPDKIVATQMARDAVLLSDDYIEILLDPYRDRRNAFYFATNPLGVRVDGLIIENGMPNRDWDAIWNVRAKRFAGGWTAEFAIPFKSLSFKKNQGVWGFNFARTIRRKVEEGRWAAARFDVRFWQVSEAGEIEGFVDIEQGRGLDIRPYFAPKLTHDNATGRNVLTGKAGGEIFYNLTPNLKLTTTINTDFAETEVDGRQINLTRFSVFFPEKRAFFLENAGAFNFGGGQSTTRGPDVIPFFSRRIGLLEGQEVPIEFGSKLTGKVGRYDIGVLGVRTRAANFGAVKADAKNLFVGRVKRNLFAQSYLGAIYTEGNPASPNSSRTVGGDVHLMTSNFLGKQNLGLDVFGIKSNNQGVNGDDSYYGFQAIYPNDKWWARVEWKHIGKDFKPALGFVARSNVNKLDVRLEYNPRLKNFLNVRQMFNEFGYTRYTRADTGEVESWRLFTAPINWQFNSGDRFEFNWVPTYERLFQPFEIADNVTLPTGEYRFTRYRLELWTASKRKWRVENTVWFGSFYSGHSTQVEAAFTYRLAPHLQFGVTTDQTFARLKEGNFVARIFALRADYSFTPNLTVSNLVQFDNESRNMGWQSRVRWILRPGNDLFVVFNQGWEQNERGGINFRTTGTKIAGKLQYTFRF